MLYNIQNIYRSACLVTEFEDAGQTIRLWGDRTHLWLDPVIAPWQGVVILINAVVQKSLGIGPPEDTEHSYTDGEVVICDRDEIEPILQDIIAYPDRFDAAVLKPCNVSIADRQRWVKQLDWNEDSERGDGPLHFFRCSKTGAEWTDVSSVIIPIEAIDEWLSDWDNSYFYWSGDQLKVQPWLVSGKTVLRQVTQQLTTKTLDMCEVWARQIDQLEPNAEATHDQWNQLHLALVPHGIFAPEDGGMLGEHLVQQGHTTLASYREAAIALYAHSKVIPGLFLPSFAHPLAATVSLHWFRLGPFHSEQQDVVKHLNYGVRAFMDSKYSNVSGGFVSSCSAGGGGAFSYAKGLSHSQLYTSPRAVQANEFDGYRLSLASATLSRSGHTVVARAIAAFAVLHEPEQFQHWVELGMTLWYDGRTAEGIAVLEHAAAMNPGFAGTSFFKEKRAAEVEQRSLLSNSGEHYLNEALPHALLLWPSLPPNVLFTLVWLRSLLTEPRFEAHWLALMDTLGECYLCREIFRGLTPDARERYLSGRSIALRKRLHAHVWPPFSECHRG